MKKCLKKTHKFVRWYSQNIKFIDVKKTFPNLPFSQKKSLVLERCFDDLMSLKINVSNG